MFENINFIKTSRQHFSEYTLDEPAPMFRRRFTINSKVKSAKLSVCGLGYAYYYLNGEKVSEDLLTAPVSNYNKTLWYNSYDVTKLIHMGDNVAGVIVGNGFYNESISTPWDFSKANWRDNPKFILKLEIQTNNGDVLIVSDENFKCTNKSPVIFNQMRNGEYFDARLYSENWNKIDFDDSEWECVIIDQTPPTGVLRECLCEPIREMATYIPKSIVKTKKGSFLFDLGQNISGYVRLKVKEKIGVELTIKYGERLYDDGCVMPMWSDYYPDSVFQTDKFICNGEEFVWSPRFAYHGFQYIEVIGLTSEPAFDTVTGVFIHQAVEEISTFDCSNELFNRIFHCGKMATKSNIHYIPTDCPTREKLGWTNDAQSSIEQFLTNFNMVKLLEKWFVDILDAMNEDGAMPGIIPTPGWGYEWGNGPVSDGILFELPYRLYLHTGNTEHLKTAIPYFKKYLKYVKSLEDEKGLVNEGLCDWAGPFDDTDLQAAPTPTGFTNLILCMKFAKIAILASDLHNLIDEKELFTLEFVRMKEILYKEYMNTDGTTNVNEQTAISMIIYHDLYENLQPLKRQLQKSIEKHNFHIDCGMVGMRHLLHALNKCDLHDYAYKTTNSSGFPSYAEWIKNGANTLWECWKCKGADNEGIYSDSHNHHMYSDIVSWFMKTVVGILPTFDGVAYRVIDIKPIFFDGMTYANGSIKTLQGIVAVDWVRKQDKVKLNITVPQGTTARVKLNQSFVMENGFENDCFELSGGEYNFDVLVKFERGVIK